MDYHSLCLCFYLTKVIVIFLSAFSSLCFYFVYFVPFPAASHFFIAPAFLLPGVSTYPPIVLSGTPWSFLPPSVFEQSSFSNNPLDSTSNFPSVCNFLCSFVSSIYSLDILNVIFSSCVNAFGSSYNER